MGAREIIERKIENLKSRAKAKFAELKDDATPEEATRIEREHAIICDEIDACQRALSDLEKSEERALGHSTSGDHIERRAQEPWVHVPSNGTVYKTWK
jgi:hypothetical protein